MRRLLVIAGLLLALIYSCSLSHLYITLLLIALVWTGLTLYKKHVRKNSESYPALFLNSVLDTMYIMCRLARRVHLVSDVEALRLPTYATLLLKPHSEVKYEKCAIQDDQVKLIIYKPTGQLANDGLIVYAHGGGWVAFTARMYHSAVSWICYQAAMVTISVDYRRPPEHPFPTALEDTYYVVKWAQHNAKRLGIDPRKVVLMGDSAGGNLAAATSAIHRDENHGFPPIKSQVLIYPVLGCYNYLTGSYLDKDLDNLRKYISYYIAGDLSLLDTVGYPDKMWGVPAYWSRVVDPSEKGPEMLVRREMAVSPDNLRNCYAFPLFDDDPTDLPDTYVLALTRDAIRDEAVHYAEWLKEHGVNVRCVEESRASHGFMFLFGSDELAVEHLKNVVQYIHEVIG